MAKPIGAFQLFIPSKEAVLNNFLSFLTIVFIPSFLILIAETMNIANFLASNLTLIEQLSLKNSLPGSRPYYILGALFSVLLLPSRYYLQLQVAKGKIVGLIEAVSDSLKYFWRIIGFNFLFALFIFLGLIAFIVPGLIVLRRYFLTPYFLIDQNLSVKEAMSASAQASILHSKAIWGVIGVSVLFSVFNIVPVWGGLAVLILTTLYSCAPALRYLELSKHAIKIKKHKV